MAEYCHCGSAVQADQAGRRYCVVCGKPRALGGGTSDARARRRAMEQEQMAILERHLRGALYSIWKVQGRSCRIVGE